MSQSQAIPPSKRYWQLVTLAGLLCLAYFSWLMLPSGGLLSSTKRIVLAASLLLFSGISAGFVFLQSWQDWFEEILARPVWHICLAFLAFTLGSGAVYLSWLSFITTDQQWYGILLRLRPLLFWLAFTGISALFWFRQPGKIVPKRREPTPPAIYIVIGAITLIGFLLRLKFLNYPAHFDEVMSYMRFASDTCWKALSFYPAPNNHVLHSLLVLTNTRLFGSSLPAIRLAAFTAGVLAIPALYWLGCHLYDALTGLLAAGLLAISSYHVQYSINGRGHVLVVLAVLMALLLAERIQRSPSPGNWLMFTMVCVLGFATIPIMLYAYVGILFWLLGTYLLKDISPEYKGLFPLYIILNGVSTTLLTLLFYSPILLISGWGALSGNAYVSSAGWAPFMSKLPGFLSEVWSTWVRDLPPGAAILIAIGILLSLVFQNQNGKPKLWLGFPIALGCAIVLFIQQAIPYTRVWLFLLPLVLLLAAAGWIGLLQRVWPKSKGAKPSPMVPVILLITFGLALSVSRSPHIYLERETGSLPQGEQLAEFLIDELKPGDVVLSNRPTYLILAYYFQQSGVENPSLQSWQTDIVAQRIYIVVNEFYGENISMVINTTDLVGVPGLGQPQLFHQFDGAAVYQLSVSP